MERPTWATIVGILGIIFGCTGILGGAQYALMPKMADLQLQMAQTLEKQAAQQQEEHRHGKSCCNQAVVPPQAMLSAMRSMYRYPDWYRRWVPWVALLQAAIYGFYLFAAITLLQTKRSGIRYMTIALLASIVFALGRGGFTLASGNIMGIMMGIGSVFGIVIDIVLLIVVLTGSKEAFASSEERT